MADPAILLLAAGAGRRFGGGKLLVEVDGQPLLLHALALARELGVQTHVVLGADAGRLQPLLPDGVVAIRHEGWAEGLGSSLAAGVRALPHDCPGVLVLLADQPALRAAALGELMARWRTDPQQVCCARYAGQPGVPALFPRRLFAELKALSGDRGAKAILRREAAAEGQIEMPEAGIDIDTVEDLATLGKPLRAS
jgi:CTP:molybdopterin cytidylyltransferase MocA